MASTNDPKTTITTAANALWAGIEVMGNLLLRMREGRLTTEELAAMLSARSQTGGAGDVPPSPAVAAIVAAGAAARSDMDKLLADREAWLAAARVAGEIIRGAAPLLGLLAAL